MLAVINTHIEAVNLLLESRASVDVKDSDGDGVPDCKDFQLQTPIACYPIDSNGIGKCDVQYLVKKAMNKFDLKEIDETPGISITNETRLKCLYN